MSKKKMNRQERRAQLIPNLKEKKPKRTTCLYIKNISTTLKNYYKAYCAKKGVTMADDILRHMKDVTSTARQIDEDNDV
jgi:hypothetical protein